MIPDRPKATHVIPDRFLTSGLTVLVYINIEPHLCIFRVIVLLKIKCGANQTLSLSPI